MIAFSAIAGMAAGDEVLPGGEASAGTGQYVVEGEFTGRQNDAAVLAAVAVAEQDVLARESTRLVGDAAIFEQANDRRHGNAQQCCMQDGTLLLLSLGYTLENQDQCPA